MNIIPESENSHKHTLVHIYSVCPSWNSCEASMLLLTSLKPVCAVNQKLTDYFKCSGIITYSKYLILKTSLMICCIVKHPILNFKFP